MSAGERNVLILALGQAATLSVVVMSMALSAIVGGNLAPDRGLATVPIAVMVVGTAIASLPAAALMHRLGRRFGFMLGAGLGIAGSALSAWALYRTSFTLFVAGHLLLGVFQGFGNYFRFAAAEAAGPAHSGRAISWVIAGGVLAAFLGPAIGQWGKGWFGAHPFVGSYVAQGLLGSTVLVLASRLRLAPVPAAVRSGTRPLRAIVAQPALRASILGAAVGYAVMITVMTATPLAMIGCGLPATSVTPVIQWHVVGMFAPSFVTGDLVKRFGAPRVMQTGFMLLAGHVAIALQGSEFLNFLSALTLLGIGWNFAFVGGTTLLTQTYPPSEQATVQAVNEFTVFGLVALASLSSGWMYDRFGWAILNLGVLPLIAIAFLSTLSVQRRLRPAL